MWNGEKNEKALKRPYTSQNVPKIVFTMLPNKDIKSFLKNDSMRLSVYT